MKNNNIIVKNSGMYLIKIIVPIKAKKFPEMIPVALSIREFTIHFSIEALLLFLR